MVVLVSGFIVAEVVLQELDSDPKSHSHLRLQVLAEVTGAWSTTDPQVLEALSAFHLWGPEFSDQRLGWRHRQPVKILELRAKSARSPLVIPSLAEYWGCFSWVNLPVDPAFTETAWHQATPALTADSFALSQQALREQVVNLRGLESWMA